MSIHAGGPLRLEGERLGDDLVVGLTGDGNTTASPAPHGGGFGVPQVILGETKLLRPQFRRCLDTRPQPDVVDGQILNRALGQDEGIRERNGDGGVALHGRARRDCQLRFGQLEPPARIVASLQGLAKLRFVTHGVGNGQRLPRLQLDEGVGIGVVRAHRGADIGHEPVRWVSAAEDRVVQGVKGNAHLVAHRAVVVAPVRADGDSRSPAWVALRHPLRHVVDVGEVRQQRVVQREFDIDGEVDSADVTPDNEVEANHAPVFDRGRRWGGGTRGRRGRVRCWRSLSVEGRSQNPDTDLLVRCPREAVRCAGPVGQLLDNTVEELMDEHLLKAVLHALACTSRRKGCRSTAWRNDHVDLLSLGCPSWPPSRSKRSGPAPFLL